MNRRDGRCWDSDVDLGSKVFFDYFGAPPCLLARFRAFSPLADASPIYVSSGKNVLEPVGFWSYARLNDNNNQGRLSALRKIIEDAIAERRGRPIKVWQDANDIPSGSAWAKTIARTIGETTFFIPIVSPRFLESQYCLEEIKLFRRRMAELKRGDLIFPIHYVDVDQTRPEEIPFGNELTYLRELQWEDFRNQRFVDPGSRGVLEWADKFAVSILSALRREAEPSQGPPNEIVEPLSQVADWNIAIDEPNHFLGREAELAEIETALKPKGAVVVLHGLRGVGKSTLAAAYAHRHRHDYSAIWWISAETDPHMRENLVALGRRFGRAGADSDDPQVETVIEQLRNRGDGVLLIFDNAKNAAALDPYMPRRGGCRALITATFDAWGSIAKAAVEIQVWSKEVGADFLLAQTMRKETRRDAVEALSEELGGLPLAHVQAAAYCEELKVSFAEYSRRLKRESMRDGIPAAKTFTLAIEEAAKLHAAAEPLIAYAALFAPEPIPLFMFTEARDKFGEPLASLTDEGLDEAIRALRAFALVEHKEIIDDVDATSEPVAAVRLHRLVRAVAVSRIEAKMRDRMRRSLAAALAVVYPRERTAAVALRRGQKDLLLPHVLNVLHFLHEDHDQESDTRDLLDPMSRLMNLALQDSGGKNISLEYLPTILGDLYEVQPLAETIGKLVEDEEAWPRLQEQLLRANNFVLRYAMAEEIAKAWTLDKVAALFGAAKNLNEFELGGYALGLKYACDPHLIVETSRLEKLANRLAYSGRSILGDLFLNLAFRTDVENCRNLRALLPSSRFWQPIWDFIKLDVWAIEAVQAFVATPRLPPPPSANPEVVRSYKDLVATYTNITKAFTLMSIGDVLRDLLTRYPQLGEDPTQLEKAKDELAAASIPDLRGLMEVFFAHPIWSVAETAATELAALIEDEEEQRSERLGIISYLLDSPMWRVQFGANEAAYQVRHVAKALFHDSVRRFHNHKNCKIRGLCAENLIADILNSSSASRDGLLTTFEKEIGVWARDEDCWVLEHVFRLFHTLHERGVDVEPLLKDGGSRLFEGTPKWYALDREAFLKKIEQRKEALVSASA